MAWNKAAQAIEAVRQLAAHCRQPDRVQIRRETWLGALDPDGFVIGLICFITGLVAVASSSDSDIPRLLCSRMFSFPLFGQI